jgi:hypothetical protein
MSKMKLKDVRQGKTFYRVYAFPERNNAFIESGVFSSPPFIEKYTNSEFVYIGTRDLIKKSLMDMGVMPNDYNFHKTFKTLNSAKRYMDRMIKRQFTEEERMRFDDYEYQNRRFDDLDDFYWDW